MRSARERLADRVAEFREDHGYDGVENTDEAFEALLDILDLAEEIVNDVPAPPALDSTSSVGLTLFEPFPVEFDGLVYATAFNAFQAQKALPDRRPIFCDVDTQTATALGRKCVIDVASWDANRVHLMTQILKKQADQHEEFRARVLAHAARPDIVHDAMIHDVFWAQEMPGILGNLHSLCTSKKRAKAQ